jgi:hypothetical protein
VYRAAPRATIETLRKIAEVGPTNLTAFQQHVGGNQIAVLNKLRELRLLGLIDPAPGRVALTSDTQAALERDALGEFLRERLRANALVTRVLDLVSSEGEVTVPDFVQELQRELPHVDIADNTWTLYARTLASWLHFSGLALLEGETIRAREVPTDESLQGREFYRGAFAPGTFMPSVRPNKALALVQALRAGPVTKSDLSEAFGKNALAGRLPSRSQRRTVPWLGRDVKVDC